jgi:maltose-binding protein MalE
MFFPNNNITFGKDQMQDIKVDNHIKKNIRKTDKEEEKKNKIIVKFNYFM